jgi:hypothetical protein
MDTIHNPNTPQHATLQDELNYMMRQIGKKDDMSDRRRAGVFIERPGRADDRQVGGSHYTQMAITPWDVVDTWPMEQRIGAYRFGALKYLMRLGNKDVNEQEALKGLHFMEKLVETLKDQQKSGVKHQNQQNSGENP